MVYVRKSVWSHGEETDEGGGQVSNLQTKCSMPSLEACGSPTLIPQAIHNTWLQLFTLTFNRQLLGTYKVPTLPKQGTKCTRSLHRAKRYSPSKFCVTRVTWDGLEVSRCIWNKYKSGSKHSEVHQKSLPEIS